MRGRIFSPGTHGVAASLGLLAFRVAVGLMMAIGHGWGKLVGFRELSAKFPDPLGIGSTLSLAGTTGAEFFCALLVALGLGTRFATLPVAFTMGVAAFLHHAADPWRRKELAILFLASFLVLAFTGAGRYSLDAFLGGKRRR